MWWVSLIFDPFNTWDITLGHLIRKSALFHTLSLQSTLFIIKIQFLYLQDCEEQADPYFGCRNWKWKVLSPPRYKTISVYIALWSQWLYPEQIKLKLWTRSFLLLFSVPQIYVWIFNTGFGHIFYLDPKGTTVPMNIKEKKSNILPALYIFKNKMKCWQGRVNAG